MKRASRYSGLGRGTGDGEAESKCGSHYIFTILVLYGYSFKILYVNIYTCAINAYIRRCSLDTDYFGRPLSLAALQPIARRSLAAWKQGRSLMVSMGTVLFSSFPFNQCTCNELSRCENRSSKNTTTCNRNDSKIVSSAQKSIRKIDSTHLQRVSEKKHGRL